MLVFWIVTPCALVGGHQRFGGAFYLHLQECRQHAGLDLKCPLLLSVLNQNWKMWTYFKGKLPNIKFNENA
jgi:hypothetical protein